MREVIEVIFFVEFQNIFNENDDYKNDETFSFRNQQSINKIIKSKNYFLMNYDMRCNLHYRL